MGYRSALGVGQEGLATPTILGMDHLLFAPVFKELIQMYPLPYLPTRYMFTHNINLIDPMS